MPHPFIPPRMVRALLLSMLLPLASAPSHAAVSSIDGAWSSLGATPPTARREFAAIYDEDHHRYLIFGGFGFGAPDPGGLYNQVWTLSLDSPASWAPLLISGPAPGERHSPQWGYDAARKRLLIFGGYGHHYPGGPNEYLNDVWQLSLDGEPAWTELHPTGTPPTGRLAGASIYDPLRQRFVGFGGTVGLPVDTWALDLSGDPAWSSVVTDSVTPMAGYGMTTIYDPVRDRMLMFGGSTSDAYFGTHNDTWELPLSGSPAWRKLTTLGTPPVGRRTLTSIYDPKRDRMVLYAGWDGNSDNLSSFLGDTWALSLSGDPTWTALSPSGTVPTGRDAMAAIYDPESDRMVVYGGWSGNTMLQDTEFLTWGETPERPVFSPSGNAAPGQASLNWGTQATTGIHAAVYRRTQSTPWSSLATVQSNAGTVTYADHSVLAGTAYAYQIVVSSQRGPTFGGEVWVNVPGTTAVTPPSAEFALRGVWPNPVMDRFSVSFSLTGSETAKLELLDVTGRRLLVRDVGELGAGSHELQLGSARDFAPGLYFVRLARAGRSLTTRVVLGAGGDSR